MDTLVHIPLMIVSLVNVVIHSLGSYVLYFLCKNNSENVTNQIFILSLSLSEIFMCALLFLSMVLHYHASSSMSVLLARNYIMVFCDTGVVLIYYLNMILLTINKLLEILLNIRYSVYVTEIRIKRLLKVTWCVGVTFSTSMVLILRFVPHSLEKFSQLTLYYYPTLDFCFLSIAVLTYGFIFRKFYFTRGGIAQDSLVVRGRGSSSSAGRRDTVWNVFRGSKFYVSVLLISSFLVFTVIPDLTLMFHTFLGIRIPTGMYAGCYILYTLSFLVDAVIYIVMQRTVRRKFWRLLRCGAFPCTFLERFLGEKVERNDTNDTWL